MKKFLAIFMIALLVLAFAGCGKTNAEGKKIENVQGQQVSVTFADGLVRKGTYTGEMVAGLMDGKGSFTTENDEGTKWTYEGEFSKGEITGQGVMTWDSGYKEEGQFVKGDLNGQGKIYDGDILTDEGSFKNGLLDGKGVSYSADDGSIIYEGIFDRGRPAISVGFNEPVSYADWEYTCTKAETHTSIGDYSTDGKYIVYLLNLKNNSKSSRQLEGDYFILEDNQGRIYDHDTMVGLEYHQNFKTKNWQCDSTGASMTSYDVPIVFEVPKDAEGFKLIPNDAYYEGVAAVEVEISE
ncbi:MAG: DUF4352 domain-containing protein [Aminipila sp.]